MLHILQLAKPSKVLGKNSVLRYARGLALSNVRKEKVEKLFSKNDEFQIRHIGPREYEQLEMLKTIGFKVAS